MSVGMGNSSSVRWGPLPSVMLGRMQPRGMNWVGVDIGVHIGNRTWDMVPPEVEGGEVGNCPLRNPEFRSLVTDYSSLLCV